MGRPGAGLVPAQQPLPPPIQPPEGGPPSRGLIWGRIDSPALLPPACRDGQKQVLPPVSNRRIVDFGAGVGRRSVYLYNLPEVTSGHQVGALVRCTGAGASSRG